MKNLINYLNEQTRKYLIGIPDITDKEYDNLLNQLEQMEKDTGIVYSNSPTQTVGYNIISDIPRVQIEPIPMLSLKKVHSQNEINNFAGKEKIVGMIKCDGISVRLIYQNGQLMSANSRGNGVEGGLITEHVKCFLNVPLTIPFFDTYIIDGEAIIKYNNFNTMSQNEDLKNPRNATAGSLNVLDLNIVRDRKLSFIAWDVIQGGSSNSFIKNLKEAENLGFEIVYYSETNNNEQILNKAKDLSIPCDGVVWKFDNISYGKTLGSTSHHFNNAIAWKPNDEEYETTLRDIVWDVGRTGVLTPVAIFEPVDADGSIIERASLHNLTIMEEIIHIPFVGQKMRVFKANQIIPQVSWSEHPAKDPGTVIPLPTVCPICGAPVEIKSDTESKFLYCSNSKCEGKFVNRAEHFLGKKGLDVKGISESTIEKLLDWGWLNNLEDVFKLAEHRADWIKKPGFGIKSVDKVLDAISSSCKCNLEAYIAALGIPLIGSTASKDLAKYFKTWDAFLLAVENPDYKFWELPNFGIEMNRALHDFDYTEAKVIADKYLIFNTVEESAAASSLAGLTFVVTGKVSRFKNRDELKAKIESLGGKVAGSVSKNTNYLINNDLESKSAKNLTAQKLGVPIISEENFLEIIDNI